MSLEKKTKNFVVVLHGGRVLMEVLSDDRLTITTTIADGISLKDYPDIKSKAGKDIYCFFFTGFFYVMMGNPGPLRTKFLCKVTRLSVPI